MTGTGGTGAWTGGIHRWYTRLTVSLWTLEKYYSISRDAVRNPGAQQACSGRVSLWHDFVAEPHAGLDNKHEEQYRHDARPEMRQGIVWALIRLLVIGVVRAVDHE